MEVAIETRELLNSLGIGEVLADKYLISKQLGEGGFAVVFGATHVRIKSLQFAVKVLRPEHATDTTNVKRFLREAETAASLRSPNVVKVADYGETATGLPYMVMEFIEGPDLEALIERYGTLRPFDVARFTLDILGALEEAHGLGIVHRDLKPANVFIVKVPGQDHPIAKVGDFGIAKVISPDSPLAPSATQTAAGNVLCTPAYAAPELLRGEVSTRGDIYALGHMMAEMLDGQTPYYADHSLLVAAKHLEPDPAPLGQWTLGSGLVDIVRRALDKDPEARYPDVQSMRADLQRALLAINSANPHLPPIALDGSDRAIISDRAPSTGSLKIAAPLAAASGTATMEPSHGTQNMTGDIAMVKPGPPWKVIAAAAAVVLLGGVAIVMATSSGEPDEPEAVASADPAPNDVPEPVAPADPVEAQPEAAEVPVEPPPSDPTPAEALPGGGVVGTTVPTPAEPTEVDPPAEVEAVAAVPEEEPEADPEQEERDREAEREREREAERRAEREREREAERRAEREREREAEREREEEEEEESSSGGANPFAPSIIRSE